METLPLETAPRRPLTPNGVLPPEPPTETWRLPVPRPAPADRADAVPAIPADLGEGTLPAPGREPPGAAGARIVIHHTLGGSNSRAAGLGRLLQSHGYAGTELRRVGVSVSEANVRYFHPSDRRIAAEVAGLMRRRGVPARLRDFTSFQPPPSRGTVEVWLPG